MSEKSTSTSKPSRRSVSLSSKKVRSSSSSSAKKQSVIKDEGTESDVSDHIIPTEEELMQADSAIDNVVSRVKRIKTEELAASAIENAHVTPPAQIVFTGDSCDDCIDPVFIGSALKAEYPYDDATHDASIEAVNILLFSLLSPEISVKEIDKSALRAVREWLGRLGQSVSKYELFKEQLLRYCRRLSWEKQLTDSAGVLVCAYCCREYWVQCLFDTGSDKLSGYIFIRKT